MTFYAKRVIYYYCFYSKNNSVPTKKTLLKKQKRKEVKMSRRKNSSSTPVKTPVCPLCHQRTAISGSDLIQIHEDRRGGRSIVFHEQDLILKVEKKLLSVFCKLTPCAIHCRKKVFDYLSSLIDQLSECVECQEQAQISKFIAKKVIKLHQAKIRREESKRWKKKLELAKAS